jgi:hypothetical protein
MYMNALFFLVPACIKCKYYQSYLIPRKYDDLAKCMKYNTTYAEEARANYKKCGLEGKWFEPL